MTAQRPAAEQAEEYTPSSREQVQAADKDPVTPEALMMTGGSLRSDAYSGGSSDSDLIAAEEGNKQQQQQQPILYDHEWQHAVYEGRRLPEDHRCFTFCFKFAAK